MSSGGTSFGTNTNAQRKRVYYAGDSTIYQGMPVCYDYLATKNVLGYDKGAGGDPSGQTSPTTTAEGNQNEGKFLRVVNPVIVSTSGGTATAGVIADTEFTGGELVGVGTHVTVTGTNMVDDVYEVTAVSDGNSATIDGRGADVTGTSVTVAVDNLSYFAGVVATGPKVGTTGPCWLDIFIPNGAIVPVRCDVDTTVGTTILSLESGSQELSSNPSYTIPNRSIAIAMETETALDTTAGITLAKLCPDMFIWQKGLITGAVAGGMALNSIQVTSAHTSGSWCAFEIKSTSGVAESSYGLAFMARAIVTDTLPSITCAAGIRLNLTGGTHLDPISALRVQLTASSGVTLSSMGSYGISVLNLTAQVSTTSDVAAYRFNWISFYNDGTQTPDGLFKVKGLGELGDHATGGSGIAEAAGDRAIPIYFGTAVYYLMAYADDNAN